VLRCNRHGSGATAGAAPDSLAARGSIAPDSLAGGAGCLARLRHIGDTGHKTGAVHRAIRGG
jgi:hypothetical protein